MPPADGTDDREQLITLNKTAQPHLSLSPPLSARLSFASKGFQSEVIELSPWIPQESPQKGMSSPTSRRTSSLHRRPSTDISGRRNENEPPSAAAFPNGYHFPPKHTFGESAKLGCVACLKYVWTPIGFITTVYGLNIVAWGGMLFLLFINAAPVMCRPTCHDANSPRMIWIEIDAQILNGLFCVTGFGLAPWRFRDLYLLIRYRLGGEGEYLRRLAGIHRSWFRLSGSTDLPAHIGPENVELSAPGAPLSAIPCPERKIPDAPLTGMRAPSTRPWKMDLVVWLMVWSTLLQCCLAGVMWGYNRHNRPAWATSIVVGIGCGVGFVAGLIMFLEGKAIKSIEGIAVSPSDLERLTRDRERGIWHYNNIKDKDLRGKDSKSEI